MQKIKKGDQVKVVVGKDKGKTGEVVRVLPKEHAVVVSGVNLYKKHVKATKDKAGGVMSVERPLNFGKVALLVASQAVRVGFTLKGKEKIRINKKTGKAI
jgi:large subunit ribosomal protein L24